MVFRVSYRIVYCIYTVTVPVPVPVPDKNASLYTLYAYNEKSLTYLSSIDLIGSKLRAKKKKQHLQKRKKSVNQKSESKNPNKSQSKNSQSQCANIGN